MYGWFFKQRLSCLFKSRNKRITYLKTLPIEIRADLRYPPFSYNWKYLRNYPNNIKDVFRSIHYHTSNNKRIDTDWWNLDSSISRFILPRLRMLIKHHHGYPADMPLYDSNIKATDELMSESWELVLAEILFAFEWGIRADLHFSGRSSYDATSPLHEEYLKNVARKDRGMQLFVKYYNTLWD